MSNHNAAMWASVVWEQEIGQRDIDIPQFGYVDLSGLGARDRREGHCQTTMRLCGPQWSGSKRLDRGTLTYHNLATWTSVVWEREIGERGTLTYHNLATWASVVWEQEIGQRDIDVPQLGYVGLSGLGARDRTEGH